MTRHRSGRALTNDAALRAAAVDLVLEVGVDALSFRDVGRAANLSHGALYARFEDVEELLVDLWGEVLVHRAIAIYRAAESAAMHPSKKAVDSVVDLLRHSSTTDVATVHVLLTSRRFAILHEEVEAFIHDYLETTGPDVTDEIRSRTLSLFSLAMLGILSAAQGGLEDKDFECLESTILDALHMEPDDVSSVEFVAPTDRMIPLPTGDLSTVLAYHTFDAIGKSGYARATISRISRRADCSPGAIYKIYPSKEDLVIGAIDSLMGAPWITVSSLAEILEPGYLAQLLYAAASPENNMRKHFALEVAMASAQSDRLRGAVRAKIRRIEAIVPLIDGLDEEERASFTCMLRVIILLVLGVGFLSILTKATDEVDFNQFTEPLRRSCLKNSVPSWPDIRRQLRNLSSMESSKS
jgi:AcrR family transcriptional regulator